MKYDICVIGLGYIGIPTATIFASCGKNVLGVDVFQKRVDEINAGLSHIGEEDINAIIAQVVKDGKLKASSKPESSEFYIIAVPTPFVRENGRKLPDLSYVESAARSIAPVLENGQCVILESTSPVDTTRNIKKWLKDELEKIGRLDKLDYESIQFAHCPERILPGQMLKELIGNDRIVGGMTPETSERVRDLYKLFCKGEIFLTDDRTAEMSKLTENASRDVQIAFANELSIVCDKLGINVWELIKLANRHPRVNILNPGPGVGGHCIAVDPWFIVAAAESETPLMKTAREVNDGKPKWVLKKVEEAIGKTEKSKPKVACLGITFKANVNDVRESPALNIVLELSKRKDCEVIISEPHLDTLPGSLSTYENTSFGTAVKEADIVLLLVDHNNFRSIRPEDLAGKILIDTKGFWAKS